LDVTVSVVVRGLVVDGWIFILRCLAERVIVIVTELLVEAVAVIEVKAISVRSCRGFGGRKCSTRIIANKVDNEERYKSPTTTTAM